MKGLWNLIKSQNLLKYQSIKKFLMQKFEGRISLHWNVKVKIALLAILKTKSLRTQEDKKTNALNSET